MRKERPEQRMDDAIRSKLSNVQPAYDPHSWDTLSHKLDQERQTEAEAIDAIIRDRLKRVDTPYQRRSWQQLALRLELEYRRTRMVISSKLAESILALLLLFVFSQSPNASADSGLSLPKQQPLAVREIPTPDNELTHQGPTSTIPANSGIKTAPSGTRAPEQNRSAALMSTNASHPANVAAPDKANAAAIQPLQTKETATEITISATNAPVEAEAISAPLPEESGATPQEHAVSGSLATDYYPTTDAINLAAAILDAPMLTPTISSLVLDPLHRNMALNLTPKPEARKTFLRIGFIGGPDYLRVITPPTRIGFDTVVALDRYALGYHGGITMGIERGRWEIESGAIYTARRYAPVPVLYVKGSLREGYFGAGLNNFELNTVTVPLNFRYNVLLRDRWRIYAMAGLSLNLVLEANYYTASESAYSTSFLPPPSSSEGAGRGEAADIPASLERRLVKGWLEGGNFWDNTTFYGTVGTGIERYMSPQWALFSQTVYQHSLFNFNGGLGPYRDRIHAMSISLGMRVRI